MRPLKAFYHMTFITFNFLFSLSSICIFFFSSQRYFAWVTCFYFQAKHNLTLPPWVTPEVMDKLGELKDFGFTILFELYKREEKSRLQGGKYMRGSLHCSCYEEFSRCLTFQKMPLCAMDDVPQEFDHKPHCIILAT